MTQGCSDVTLGRLSTWYIVCMKCKVMRFLHDLEDWDMAGLLLFRWCETSADGEVKVAEGAIL